MVTGETGQLFLTALNHVAVESSIVYEIVTIQVLPLAVSGVLEMTKIFSHATMRHAHVTPYSFLF